MNFSGLATNQSSLVSLFKKRWDQEWKKLNVFIILCGSISSYIVKKSHQVKSFIRKNLLGTYARTIFAGRSISSLEENKK